MRGYALIRAGIDLGVPGSLEQVAFYELGAAGARLHPHQLASAQRMASALATGAKG